jgi:hypothetical protein
VSGGHGLVETFRSEETDLAIETEIRNNGAGFGRQTRQNLVAQAGTVNERIAAAFAPPPG